MANAFLERWLGEVLAAPGATGIDGLGDARRMLLDDALRAVPIVESSPGRVIDVGSGGGTPGIPLAVVLAGRSFTLLEAGRAEEQQTDVFGVALAKALAKPPVAAELCLPLVRPGGIAIIWVGENPELDRVGHVAEKLGSHLEDEADGLLVLRKTESTPAGFPRRPGMAKKRPLA